jgi:hypothetical protein
MKVELLEEDHLLHIHKPLVRIADRKRFETIEVQSRCNVCLPGVFRVACVQLCIRQFCNLLAEYIEYRKSNAAAERKLQANCRPEVERVGIILFQCKCLWRCNRLTTEFNFRRQSAANNKSLLHRITRVRQKMKHGGCGKRKSGGSSFSLFPITSTPGLEHWFCELLKDRFHLIKVQYD